MRRIALALLALALPITAEAQVLITEVQYDPTSTGDIGEWVEIHNTGTSPASIEGWSLNDYTGTAPAGEQPTRWTFPAGATLAAGQVIVVTRSQAGYATNTPANLYVTPASFECADGSDDPNIPNLTAAGGTAQMALANGATGDAIVLRDQVGTLVSAAEYGTVDRTVPGIPTIGGV